MYHAVKEVLEDVYSIQGVRMEPMNGTATVCEWCKNKGVKYGGGDLTQADKHANAAMIISRIERVLNRYELAAVECKYSQDLSGIIDLTAYIEEQNNGVNLLLCDALVSHILKERPKRLEIMDKYDISNGYFYKRLKKVKSIIAAIEYTAGVKLYDEFKSCGII